MNEPTLSPVIHNFLPLSSENTSRNCCINPTSCKARSTSFYRNAYQFHFRHTGLTSSTYSDVGRSLGEAGAHRLLDPYHARQIRPAVDVRDGFGSADAPLERLRNVKSVSSRLGSMGQRQALPRFLGGNLRDCCTLARRSTRNNNI